MTQRIQKKHLFWIGRYFYSVASLIIMAPKCWVKSSSCDKAELFIQSQKQHCQTIYNYPLKTWTVLWIFISTPTIITIINTHVVSSYTGLTQKGSWHYFFKFLDCIKGRRDIASILQYVPHTAGFHTKFTVNCRADCLLCLCGGRELFCRWGTKPPTLTLGFLPLKHTPHVPGSALRCNPSPN